MSFDYRRNFSGLATTSEKHGKNTSVYSQDVFGKNIFENSVPVWTADGSENPYVVFTDPNTGLKMGINRERLGLGMLVIGAPGAGKTNFINANLKRILETMESDDVIIVFDTKGDYLTEFGGMIADRDKIVIGIGEEYRNETSYHNIFAEIMPRGMDGRLVYTMDSDTDALDFSTQLFSKMDSEIQPVFPAMAGQIFAAVLVYYMRTFWKTDQSKLNNKELLRFFSHSTNEDIRNILCLDYMKDYRKCTDYISGKSSETQGVNSYLGAVIGKMFIGPFAESCCGREFSMREVVYGSRKKVLFIEYDLQRGNVLAPMYGMLIDRALAYALGGREKVKKNKYFLLDEALLLPKLEHLQNSTNFGRSQGIKIICGSQNIEGFESLYGEAGAKNMLSSFQNIVAFKVTDYDTRQFLIQRLGENYINHSISAQQQSLNVQREGHTIEDWQLLSLQKGEAVVSLAWEDPFLFKIARIVAWLYPDRYSDAAYQSQTALYSIGSGGFWGVGLGRMYVNIPEGQTDFIFVLLTHQLGIFGGICLILCYVYLLFQILKIALNACSLYETILVIGILIHIATQVVVNMGVCTSLLPNTGLPLVLMSYGGSSILTSFAELAICVSVSKKSVVKVSKKIAKEELG